MSMKFKITSSQAYWIILQYFFKSSSRDSPPQPLLFTAKLAWVTIIWHLEILNNFVSQILTPHVITGIPYLSCKLLFWFDLICFFWVLICLCRSETWAKRFSVKPWLWWVVIIIKNIYIFLIIEFWFLIGLLFEFWGIVENTKLTLFCLIFLWDSIIFEYCWFS